jgi:hypothetical protein
MIAVWAFHALFPRYEGIPWWLFTAINLPALGIEILPLIFLIEVVLVLKGVYRKHRFVVQAVLLAVAWCFCLQGLRQSLPIQPKATITAVGRALVVMRHGSEYEDCLSIIFRRLAILKQMT